MLAIVLGLASALSWGVADFFGGLASRRAAALAVVALSQGAGLLVALVALGVLRPDVPPPAQLATGVAAGVSGAVGLAAFYRGLAIGAMSIVAPISALGALVPLLVDLAGGHAPGALALAGMALALAGAVLAASAPGKAVRRGAGLAVVAAVGFGGFFSLLAEAAGEGPLWALVSARCGSVPLALIAVWSVGATLRTGLPTLRLVIAAGVLDASANLLFAVGTREGLVSVVAVLGSLYPVVTVALAAAVLRERFGPLQAVGAGGALAGVALIAAA